MNFSNDDVPANIGAAFAQLRRRTARRRSDLTRNLVLNIIDEADGRITVGGIADEMTVAQPVASRAVAACVADGLVRRVPAQEDGRRNWLELTPAGDALRDELAAEQRLLFEQITESWSSSDRSTFARLLVRYAEDSAEWAAARKYE